jgi:hypothetical protein
MADELHALPAHQRTAQAEEGLVDIGPALVAHLEAAQAIEPGEAALDDPASLPIGRFSSDMWFLLWQES